MKHLNEGGKKLLARGAFETSQGNEAGGIVQICPPLSGAFFRDKDSPPNFYNANGEPLKTAEPDEPGPTAQEIEAAEKRAKAAEARRAKAEKAKAEKTGEGSSANPDGDPVPSTRRTD